MVAAGVNWLHGDAVVVDSHNDLLGLVARRPAALQAEYFRTQWLPQLREGGVDVQVLPVWSETDDFGEVVLMLDAGSRIAEANSDVVALCLDGRGIESALAEDKVALILAMESCGAIGSDVALVETLFRLGVRVASFTHHGRTALADGSGVERDPRGLTPTGVEVLAAFDALGILTDVSHLSAPGVDQVLELARRPVVATHSSSFSLCPSHRNLNDDQLRAIAATGGVIGVNFLGYYIDPVTPTSEKVVDHVLHIACIAGIQHVGLGPDFIEEYAREIGIPRLLENTIPALGGPSGLPIITDVLISRGIPENDIRAILGRNWLHVLRSEIGVSR